MQRDRMLVAAIAKQHVFSSLDAVGIDDEKRRSSCRPDASAD